VLVFKEATGKTTVKVTDFGYSTFTIDEEGSVLLPKSRPWNAPEHHFGEFTISEAKKTDVYSFGMLCIWVLFGNSLPDVLITTAEEETKSVSFNAPLGPRTLLEKLRDEGKVEQIANQLVELMTGLNTEYKTRLKGFFSLTLQLNPAQRTSNFEKLVRLLSPNR